MGLYLSKWDGAIADANTSMVQLLGYPDRQSLLQVRIADLFEDPQELEGWLDELRRYGVVHGATLRWRRFDGSTVWVRSSARCFDGGDAPEAWIEGSLEDASAWKREDEERRESEARYRLAFLASPDYVYVTDVQGGIVEANPALLERVGLSLDEIRQKNVSDFPPGDAGYIDGLLERLRQGEELHGLEIQARNARGEVYDYEVNAVPLWADGQIIGVLNLARDITGKKRVERALQESEERYRTVSELTSDFVFSLTVGPDGALQHEFVTESFTRATGFVLGEFLDRTDHPFNLVAPVDRPTIPSILEELLAGRSISRELRVLTKGGETLWVQAYARPVWDESEGRYVRIIGAAQDITERKRNDLRARQQERMASVGHLAAGLAHELRNPLGIVSACAQLLLEDPDDLEVRTTSADKMHLAAQRASLIIENLLRFAYPERAPMEAVDLHRLLQATLSSSSHLMAVQGIAQEREFHSEPLYVQGNAGLLEQALANLIVNACTAMPEGGTLTVMTRVSNGQAEIVVCDSGDGIPPEQLPMVFDPFFQRLAGETSLSLGLAISYSIIQQHEGSIAVESRVGEGTSFVIQLPRVNNPGGERTSGEGGTTGFTALP